MEKTTRKLDINTGTLQDFEEFGIEEAMAKALIRYREQHGFFRDFDDLRNVPGITDELAEKLNKEAALGPAEEGEQIHE